MKEYSKQNNTPMIQDDRTDEETQYDHNYIQTGINIVRNSFNLDASIFYRYLIGKLEENNNDPDFLRTLSLMSIYNKPDVKIVLDSEENDFISDEDIINVINDQTNLDPEHIQYSDPFHKLSGTITSPFDETSVTSIDKLKKEFKNYTFGYELPKEEKGEVKPINFTNILETSFLIFFSIIYLCYILIFNPEIITV